MMESLAGTTSLQALAIGFGLETDSKPKWEQLPSASW
jgi:hypothetical protein